MNAAPRAYIAGPLFDEGERWWIETIEDLVHKAGFTTFLPHRDNPPKTADNSREIYVNDKRGIDECELIVANLNGLTTDDGTAWELGYGFAKGKYAIGYFSDWRQRFPNGERVNLMMEESLDVIVDSLEALQVALDEWTADRTQLG